MPKYLFVLFALLFIACDEPVVPRPRGELRLDYAAKKYSPLDLPCPYQFELPTYAQVSNKTIKQGSPCWRNIEFPDQDATIYFSYTPVDGKLHELIKNSRDLTYEHTVKASNIESELILRHEEDVYGLVYDLSGNAASLCQFYLTDSVNHFVRGSLYFNCKPNWDSLAPSVDYIRADIQHLIDTFKWKEPSSP